MAGFVPRTAQLLGEGAASPVTVAVVEAGKAGFAPCTAEAAVVKTLLTSAEQTRLLCNFYPATMILINNFVIRSRNF